MLEYCEWKSEARLLVPPFAWQTSGHIPFRKVNGRETLQRIRHDGSSRSLITFLLGSPEGCYNEPSTPAWRFRQFLGFLWGKGPDMLLEVNVVNKRIFIAGEALPVRDVIAFSYDSSDSRKEVILTVLTSTKGQVTLVRNSEYAGVQLGSNKPLDLLHFCL